MTTDRQGWQCPGCGRVWSPDVRQCDVCLTPQPPLAKSEATGSMLGKRRLVEGDGTL